LVGREIGESELHGDLGLRGVIENFAEKRSRSSD